MRIRSLLLCAVAALSTTVAAAPLASAAPGNTVVLGDSLTANPNGVDYLAGKGLPVKGRVEASGCGSDGLYTNTYGYVAGRAVSNYTCAGASMRTGGTHFKDLAESAARSGALDAGTREVVILGGANDTYPYMTGPNPLPMPVIERNLFDSYVDTINFVRSKAPNARIKVSGYPQISNGTGNVCLINTVPGAPVQDVFFQVGEAENVLQRAAADASRATGSTFVDLKPVSRGHEMCSNDRWMTGLIDTTSAPHNLPLHMTNDGLAAIAAATARV